MTTKPKVSRYNRKRAETAGAMTAAAGLAANASASPEAARPDAARPNDDAQLPPAPAQAPVQGPAGAGAGAEPIRVEKLTSRQLRMARRVAEKRGLTPSSDVEAVQMLRAQGIDPFHSSNIVGLITRPKSAQPADGSAATQPGGELVKQTVQLPIAATTAQLPAANQPNASPSRDDIADRRGREIIRIQKDIARRRRRKLFLLFVRMSVFVFLPTLLAGYYFYTAATPMYTTKSEFLILSADGGTSGGLAGGLLPSQFATGQDSVATQSYLESKDAMLRLDADQGFRAHYSQDWIDPMQRLAADASNEDMYKLYQKYVKLGYDQAEGVIRMELSTADPELSAQFSRTLIQYAEERVDELSQEKRRDAMATAQESLEDAKAQRRAAQERLVALQESTILDPEGEIGSIRALIGSVEQQLQEKELARSMLLNNARPNRARVDALDSEIAVLKTELERQKARLTDATTDQESLAAQTADIQLAEADLLTADMILQSALESVRQASIEANKQVRYLTVSVRPVTSQDPSYPRAFEDTLVSFLIFLGIYLMLSMTASILREQVSS